MRQDDSKSPCVIGLGVIEFKMSVIVREIDEMSKCHILVFMTDLIKSAVVSEVYKSLLVALPMAQHLNKDRSASKMS